MFSKRKEAKEAGWFSRRHRTSEAHIESTAAYRFRRGHLARIARANERASK